MVLHRLATRKEDDDLLLQVLAQECEQQQEALVTVTHYVALLEVLCSRCVPVRVHVDVKRARSKRHPGEIRDLGGLRSREQHRLTIVCV